MSNDQVSDQASDQASERSIEPWAEVLALGDARFGILVGGPFDGRCFPLLEGTPLVLDVPGPEGPGQPATLRYILREGLYRYAGTEVPSVFAA